MRFLEAHQAIRPVSGAGHSLRSAGHSVDAHTTIRANCCESCINTAAPKEAIAGSLFGD